MKNDFQWREEKATRIIIIFSFFSEYLFLRKWPFSAIYMYMMLK